MAVFFAGSVIAGAGFGSGFQGSIRMVVPLAAAHQRAGLVSLIYVVSYLGLRARRAGRVRRGARRGADRHRPQAASAR